jgi:hypothetical protein
MSYLDEELYDESSCAFRNPRLPIDLMLPKLMESLIFKKTASISNGVPVEPLPLLLC